MSRSGRGFPSHAVFRGAVVLLSLVTVAASNAAPATDTVTRTAQTQARTATESAPASDSVLAAVGRGALDNAVATDTVTRTAQTFGRTTSDSAPGSDFAHAAGTASDAANAPVGYTGGHPSDLVDPITDPERVGFTGPDATEVDEVVDIDHLGHTTGYSGASVGNIDAHLGVLSPVEGNRVVRVVPVEESTSDLAPAVDTVTRAAQLVTRTTADSAPALDAALVRARLAAADSAPAVDTVTRTGQVSYRTTSDSAPALDSAFTAAQIRGSSDSAPAVDTAIRGAQNVTRTATDSAPAHDAATGPRLTAGDVAPATDLVSRAAQAFTRTATDSAPAVVVVRAGTTVTVSASDTAPAVDTVTRAAQHLTRTAPGVAPATDLVSRAAQAFTRTATDSAPGSDVVVLTSSSAHNGTNSAPAVDTVTRAAQHFTRTATEAAPATDSTSRTVEVFVRTSTDLARAIDTVSRAAQHVTRTATDAAPATDSASGARGVHTTDSAPAVDTVTRLVQVRGRTVSDAAPAIDHAGALVTRPDGLVRNANPNWPLVGVEVAFDSDFGPPDTPPLLFRQSINAAYRRLVARKWEIRRGRQYELDQVQAGEATIEIPDPLEYLNPDNPDSPFNVGGDQVMPYRPMWIWSMWPNQPGSGNIYTDTVTNGIDSSFESGFGPIDDFWTPSNSLTTASFSPPAATMLVALVALGRTVADGSSVTVRDSLGNTWSKVANTGPGGGQGEIAIAWRYFSTAPGAITVSATFTGGAPGTGSAMAVKVLVGASATTGKAWYEYYSGGTTDTDVFTTSTAGSVVYGVATNPNADTTWTSNAATTQIGSTIRNPSDSAAMWRSATPTVTPGNVTFGGTWGQAGAGLIQGKEFLRAVSGTPITEDASSPAVVVGAAAFGSSTDQVLAGTRSLKVVQSAPGFNYGVYAQRGNVTAPGITYTASVWVYPTGGTTVTIYAYDANGHVHTGTSAAAQNTWSRIFISWTAVDTLEYINISGSGAATPTYYLDAMMLEFGAALSAWTPNGPTLYPLFTGYTERYPTNYDMDGYRAIRPLVAVDALAVLSRTSISQSYNQEITQDTPQLMMKFDDGASPPMLTGQPQGFGQVVMPTGGSVDFGGDTLPDGSPAVTIGQQIQTNQAVVSTTLYASAAYGATSIQLQDTVAVGDYIQIEAGTNFEEWAQVTAITGAAAPYTATITESPFGIVGLQTSHPSGSDVTSYAAQDTYVTTPHHSSYSVQFGGAGATFEGWFKPVVGDVTMMLAGENVSGAVPTAYNVSNPRSWRDTFVGVQSSFNGLFFVVNDPKNATNQSIPAYADPDLAPYSNRPDGQWHYYALRIYQDPTNPGRYLWSCHVDTNVGLSQGVTGTQAARRVRFNELAEIASTFSGPPQSTVSAARVAYYPYALSTDRLLAHAARGLGNIGELSGARVARLLAKYWTGPSVVAPGKLKMAADFNYDPTTQTLTKTSGAGQGRTLLDVLQEIQESERGLVYADRFGQVVFEDRESRYIVQSPRFTLGENPTDVVGVEYPYSAYQADFDPTYTFTQADLTSPTNSDFLPLVNTEGERRFGQRVVTQQVQAVYDFDLEQAGIFYLSRYATPKTRISKLTLKPAANPALWPIVLGLEISQRVTVTRRSQSGVVVTADYYVESIQMQVDPEAGEWAVDLQLSPVFVTSAWVLGDATRGVLSQTTVPIY